jgi:hypothetical protein
MAIPIALSNGHIYPTTILRNIVLGIIKCFVALFSKLGLLPLSLPSLKIFQCSGGD